MNGISRTFSKEEIFARGNKEIVETLEALTKANDMGIRCLHLVEPLLATYGFDWVANIAQNTFVFDRFNVEKIAEKDLENFERAHVWHSAERQMTVITYDYGNGNSGFSGLFDTENVQKIVKQNN